VVVAVAVSGGSIGGSASASGGSALARAPLRPYAIWHRLPPFYPLFLGLARARLAPARSYRLHLPCPPFSSHLCCGLPRHARTETLPDGDFPAPPALDQLAQLCQAAASAPCCGRATLLQATRMTCSKQPPYRPVSSPLRAPLNGPETDPRPFGCRIPPSQTAPTSRVHRRPPREASCTCSPVLGAPLSTPLSLASWPRRCALGMQARARWRGRSRPLATSHAHRRDCPLCLQTSGGCDCSHSASIAMKLCGGESAIEDGSLPAKMSAMER